MSGWSPAKLDDVLNAIDEVAEHAGPNHWESFAPYLVKPYVCHIRRGDQWEPIFVVARASSRVVFFEDVEDNFGTATEDDGRLHSVCDYVDLRVAIREALRESGDNLID